MADSIAAGNFRLLNTAEYFALELPTAKRLYRYLDYRRWRGPERQPAVTVPLKQLAQELPIDREAPSHIRRTLDPAHAQLIERGFLAAAEYEETLMRGKKRPIISVMYRFAEPSLPPPPPADGAMPRHADHARDPDCIRATVAEILGLLRDEHSLGFYVKVARTLPEEALRNVIGGIRQSIREGVSLEVARKLFTATARKRAEAMNLDL